jgi:nucleoid-associated protein YgaU
VFDLAACLLLLASAVSGSAFAAEAAAAADDAQDRQRAALRADNGSLRERIADLEAEILRLDQNRVMLTREREAQLEAAELRFREHKDRVLGCESELRAQTRAFDDRAAEIASLKARIDLADRRAALLVEHIEVLRARLPGPEGGTITANQARARAERDAAALSKLATEARGVDNPSLWLQLRDAENALHRSQFLLARADNARTVYRVRPGDTLDLVSLLFYHDRENRDRIYDSNRHVLQQPDPLLPGLTLVIP